MLFVKIWKIKNMNENLNLCEILKDCPKGEKLYATFLGDVKLVSIINETISVES